MDVLSLVLTIVGLAISGMAFLKAKSARDAVNAVVGRHNEQIDRDRLRGLVEKLTAAKEAAKRRRAGAANFLSTGRSLEVDLHILQEADDALKTGLPFEVEGDLAADLRGAAEEIGKALETIADHTANRDGWKDALSTLQVIVPRLEQAERDRRNRELRLTETL